VGCARVNEVRKPELLYSPEPLKGARLEHFPEHALDLQPIDIELDEVV
jgi:hypothetical protein